MRFLTLCFAFVALLATLPVKQAQANPFFGFEGVGAMVVIFAPRDLHPSLYNQIDRVRADYRDLQDWNITTVRVIQGRNVELYPALSTASLGRELPDEPGQAYSAYDIDYDEFAVVVLDIEGDVALQSDKPVDGDDIMDALERLAAKKEQEAQAAQAAEGM